MNNNIKYKKGQLIVLHTDNEWNKLPGIIDEIDYENETLIIFTVQIPYFTYNATFEHADQVLELIN